MLQLDLTYAQETCDHDAEIEDINKEAFGPGRFVRAAYRIREGGDHDRNLSYVALNMGQVIASVRMTPIRIGKIPALLLGPLAVRDSWKNRGIGRHLMQQAMETASQTGHSLVLLVGDAPYYKPFGFVKVDANKIHMPAPVDPERLLACILPTSATKDPKDTHLLDQLAGEVRHADQA